MRFLAAALAAFFLSALPAVALHQANQIRCGEASKMKSVLKNKWGEYPVASGVLTGAGYVMVMYANDSTGTWSVVRFTPEGIACLMGAGDSFNRFKKPKPEGKPA